MRMRGLRKTSSAAGPAIRRHVPERTCVGCREVKPKRELVRLVCGPGGVVEVDLSGRRPGRGAYLCCAPECWQKGVNRGKLEHALRSRLSVEDRARLMEMGGAITIRESRDESDRMGEVR